ncbi:MAG: nicotinate (nicotinamide) nucleotide adenylyltransferase [Verrucomicrobia bacterium]|jgi:nicotinate-nucleotide adenylyltransferase|nr:nicotinate (nicotinamide) nucleotide adenylyltransferase [Verrucomicrobiota bacterium]
MKPTLDPTKTTFAVALYGGSFDPVHRAHIEVARAVLREVDVEQVVFLPAARSPLKGSSVQADAASRLQMVHLATEGGRGFSVDDRELRRGGTSYTIDTVRAYAAEQPEVGLYWIIGGDQLELLPRWHAIEELARLVCFVVLQRPDYATRAPEIPGLRYLEVEAPLMEHSSTEIRERIAAGEPVGDWLPRSVEAFIYEHGLYTR